MSTMMRGAPSGNVGLTVVMSAPAARGPHRKAMGGKDSAFGRIRRSYGPWALCAGCFAPEPRAERR